MPEEDDADMKLFTIGFTKRSAEEFFGLIEAYGIERIVDVRLNNVSQLAGFTKRCDLQFFLREICGSGYLHLPECAPTKEILDAFKKKLLSWTLYEERFLKLIAERRIETILTADTLDHSCLLCSEPTPDHCHRRLVAEYLQARIAGLQVLHL